MRLMLTDRFCDRAKSAAVQTDYFDEAMPGLALRVGRGKTWTFLFTWGGRRVRMTLGAYPAISLAAARTRALEAKAALEAGNDPRSSLNPETFKAICEAYMSRDGAGLRTRPARMSALQRLVYPTLGDRPIADIRRSDIVRLMDTIEDANGPVMADRTLAVIRRVMNWHASRSDDFRSPIVRGMTRTTTKDLARERVLSDDELRAVWEGAECFGVFGAYVQFLLLTATRRNEAARMTWTELADGVWTIPANRMKAKAEHVIPLSTAAQTILRKGPGAGFVFKAPGGAALRDNPKARFDRACGVSGWRLHDLRRTARSLMSRAGVSADVAERCLAHAISGVRGTYDRHSFLEEKRRAFEALAGQIDRIVNPRANVVEIGRGTA
jgi:integrase